MKDICHHTLLATTILLLCDLLAAGENRIDEAFYRSDAFLPILAWGNISLAGDLAESQEYYDGLKECGFTLAGFATTPEQLDHCAAAGIKCYYGTKEIYDYDWQNPPSEEEMKARVAPVVARFNGHPAVHGYYIKDEPVFAEFPGLAQLAGILRRLAPGKEAHINLFPQYASARQLGNRSYSQFLDDYMQLVQPEWTGYDYYGFRQGEPITLKEQFWENLATFGEAARRNHVKFVFCGLACAHWNYPVITEGMLAVQAYGALAYGARGLNWYTYQTPPWWGGYHDAPLSRQGFRTPLWGAMQNLHRTILRYAPVINHLEWRRAYHFGGEAEFLARPDDSCLVRTAGSEQLLVSEFRHDRTGDDYILVVNKDFRLSRPIQLKLRDESRAVFRLRPWDAGEERYSGAQFWLPPGQAYFFRLPQVAAEN